jgi:hypothetical protein
MKRKFTSLLIALPFIIITNTAFAQNSLLVNFGTSSCSSAAEPAFSLINNPLDISSSPLTNCSLVNQQPDIFSVFIAYNPKNNKIYVADIRSGLETKIWVLDMGMPANINCPASIPVNPDYSYSYISNNFEFDNNGDLWSFSNYNDSTGRCNLDRFDVTTGEVINTRLVQFPEGNFPTAITSGDFTILPNGRMFATLGSNPSRLYEITNYNGSSAAIANYLTTLPQNCYGIAYLNGQLEITGFNFFECYYYDYNITTNVLGDAKSFQNEQLPIDNTSITPSLGVTKELTSTIKINDNTADLTYEIYVRNLGNVGLNNINVTDNLADVYGAENISNVTASFVPGANAIGLQLNPEYNGNTNNELLLAGQNLPNNTSTNADYFFKLRISIRVTNLSTSKVYLNSAVGSASIGSFLTSSLINVSDSSNNGNENVVDPNNNGNAKEERENIPTPFSLGVLPVRFIDIDASLSGKNIALVSWSVAVPTVNSGTYRVETSSDGVNWSAVGVININNPNQSIYNFLHVDIPQGNLYYRIKQTDDDGDFIYSKVVLLRNKIDLHGFTIFPNPANNKITLRTPYIIAGKTKVTLYDAFGKQLTSATIKTTSTEINTSHFSNGTYLLKITNGENIITQKVLVLHK